VSDEHTPERTIAEILGWTLCDVWDCPDQAGHWITAAGEQCVPGYEPSVDDMLAWLVEHDRFVALSAVKGTAVMVEVVLGNTTRFHATKRGATLMEAFEAAVRAVAGGVAGSTNQEPRREDSQ
jgi:hypothetical protein